MKKNTVNKFFIQLQVISKSAVTASEKISMLSNLCNSEVFFILSRSVWSSDLVQLIIEL